MPSPLSSTILLLVLAITATATTCRHGYFARNGGCQSCLYSCKDSSDPCAATCHCASTSQCSSLGSGKLVMCEKGVDNPFPTCVSCSERCGSHYTRSDSAPTNTSAANAPGCAAHCTCSAHSECPVNYYCGRSRDDSLASTCHNCSECTHGLSVNGSCPIAQCAASMECQVNTDCDPPTSWCSNGFQCKACSSNCYIPQSYRDRYMTRDGPITTQQCSKDCCGWNTFPSEDEDHTYSSIDFRFGLCDSEEYSNFSAYFIRQSTLDNSHSVDDLKNGLLFGTSPSVAEALGAVRCSVAVDQNAPGIYPRQVPLFDCTNLLRSCKTDDIGIVAYAVRHNQSVVIGTKYFPINTHSDTCLNLSLGSSSFLSGNTITIIIIVLCCIVGCCCVGLCAYIGIIRPQQDKAKARAATRSSSQNHPHPADDDDDIELQPRDPPPPGPSIEEEPVIGVVVE